MRLVVWNANMAAHRKLATVLQRLHPDVLVLCECADEATLSGRHPGNPPWTSMAWAGKVPDPPRKPDKGLAVMTFGDYRIAAQQPVSPAMEWLVIADIVGPLLFSLIAVWAMNHRASNIKAFPQSNPQPAAVGHRRGQIGEHRTRGMNPRTLVGIGQHRRDLLRQPSQIGEFPQQAHPGVRHNPTPVARYFHQPRCRDILHLRGAFPLDD